MLTERPVSSRAFVAAKASARVSPATNRSTSRRVGGAAVTSARTRDDLAAARITGRSGFDASRGNARDGAGGAGTGFAETTDLTRPSCADTGSRWAARTSP